MTLIKSTELPLGAAFWKAIKKISGDDKASCLSQLANQATVLPVAVQEDNLLRNTAWIGAAKIVSNSTGILFAHNVTRKKTPVYSAQFDPPFNSQSLGTKVADSK